MTNPIVTAALDRGWKMEYLEDAPFYPCCWYRPDGKLHDCYDTFSELPIADIAAAEKGHSSDV